MTFRLIPSTGEMRRGSFINLNRHGYKAGERVLFEKPWGEPHVGTIALMDQGNPNLAIMEPEGERPAWRVICIDIKARIPAGWSAERESELLDALRAAFAEGRHLYDQRRKTVIREHFRR
jgi:hypothetical protein